MVKNGNMRFLLLVLILSDHLVRSTPSPSEASSYQERQYKISTVRAHIGRSSGRSLPPLLESSSGQEWQYEISTVSAHIGRSTGRYVSPFLLLELIVADHLADLPPPPVEHFYWSRMAI